MSRFGWKRDLPSLNDPKYSEHSEMLCAAPLPPLVDLRPLLPPIKDQGTLGSCVSNGTALALEFVQLKALKDKTPEPEIFEPKYDSISRLFIYYNARVLDGDVQYDNGTQIRTAITAIRQKGICEESVWPYGSKYLFIAPSISSYKEGINHEVCAAYRINNAQIEQMKICLNSGFPIIFGVTLYSSFESTGSNGMVSFPESGDQVIGGHCMTCVGYDDTRQVFIVANSWGTGWGDQGFCYMPYSYLSNENLATDFWTIREK